jgi:hypothetical protein
MIYVYENGKLVAKTVATTAKGGFYDQLHHLEIYMEKKQITITRP